MIYDILGLERRGQDRAGLSTHLEFFEQWYNIMFLSFFKTQEGGAKNPYIQFYRNPNVVSTIFRALDDLSQALILRMMREGFLILQAHFSFMIADNNESRARLTASLSLLKSLSIFIEKDEGYNKPKYITLHDKFRLGIQKYITQPEEGKGIPIPSYIKEEEPVPLYNFLYDPKADIVTKVLKESKLIDREHSITKDGFSFVLQDISTQICILLKGYTYLRKRLDLWEPILEISNLALNKAYLQKPSWPQELISDLRSFKFITVMKIEDDQTYISVNKIFKNFSFQQPNLDLSLKCDIIVETNFKIYAHIKSMNDRTNYEVLKKILEIFLELDFPHIQFQQLVVGTLVEQKVKQAYERGLTSEQILKFFRKHTDMNRINETRKKTQVVSKVDQLYNEKKMKLKFLKIYNKEESDILPNNVVQELKLWEDMKEWNATGEYQGEDYNSEDD